MPKHCLRQAIPLQCSQLGSVSFPAIRSVADQRPSVSHSHGWRRLLCGGIAIALLMSGGHAHAEPIAARSQGIVATADRIAGFMAEASQRFGIPSSWIRAVMRAESLGDVRALSPKGAMGLMQIMPETWADLRARYGLGTDPYDPHDNIMAGAAYLRELHDRYGAPGFLAAYNAGPARWEDHRATGRPLPAETRAYLAALTPVIDGGSIDGAVIVVAETRSWTEAPLFAVDPQRSDDVGRTTADPHAGRPSNDTTAQDWTALAPQSDGLFVATSRRPSSP